MSILEHELQSSIRSFWIAARGIAGQELVGEQLYCVSLPLYTLFHYFYCYCLYFAFYWSVKMFLSQPTSLPFVFLFILPIPPKAREG